MPLSTVDHNGIKNLPAFILILLLIITGCSKEDEPDDPEAQQLYSEVFGSMNEGENLFNELSSTMDTITAMDSVLNYLLKDSTVIWGKQESREYP